jgi:acyl-CoA synthetase (AMP-forming)/AMP-acid ligase II
LPVAESCLITSADFNFDLPSASRIKLSRKASIEGISSASKKRSTQSPHPGTSLILSTSGASGEPKEVELKEESLLYMADLLVNYFDLRTNTVAAVVMPMFHTMALNTQFFPTLLAGGRCSFVDTTFGAARIYRQIIESDGNFLALTGNALTMCFSEYSGKRTMLADRIKDLQLAGDKITDRHLAMARALFPSARLTKGYGLTEAIRVSMISSNDPGFEAESCGHILPRQTVEIRNETGLAMAGQVGEVYVRGPNIMSGYSDPSAPSVVDERGFLRTGDVGRLLPDHQLAIEGRLDRVFKHRGHKVSPMEVEAVALRWPGTRQAICVSAANEKGELLPVLFVEADALDRAQSELEEYLRPFAEYLRSRLSPSKMPRHIFILNKMPLTPSAKIHVGDLGRLWTRRSELVRTYDLSRIQRFYIIEVDDLRQDP